MEKNYRPEQAFPGPCQHEQQVDIHEGMTLRDYFAAQAMIGILASRKGFLVDCGTENAPQWAYQVADAMLAARDEECSPSPIGDKRRN